MLLFSCLLILFLLLLCLPSSCIVYIVHYSFSRFYAKHPQCFCFLDSWSCFSFTYSSLVLFSVSPALVYSFLNSVSPLPILPPSFTSYLLLLLLQLLVQRGSWERGESTGKSYHWRLTLCVLEKRRLRDFFFSYTSPQEPSSFLFLLSAAPTATIRTARFFRAQSLKAKIVPLKTDFVCAGKETCDLFFYTRPQVYLNKIASKNRYKGLLIKKRRHYTKADIGRRERVQI